jgi:tRNA G26 N,N-dimethylase Trm1
MNKLVKITENDLTRLVKKVLREQDVESENYMFFSNLQQIARQCKMLLELDHEMIDQILLDGHDWADDHVTEAKVNMDQVFDLVLNCVQEVKQPQSQSSMFIHQLMLMDMQFKSVKEKCQV